MMSWVGVSRNNALQLKLLFPKEIHIYIYILLWKAFSPNGVQHDLGLPASVVLAQGSPFLQASLGRGWGLGDRGLEGSRRVSHRVKEQIKAQPTHHRGSLTIFTRSELRAHR